MKNFPNINKVRIKPYEGSSILLYNEIFSFRVFFLRFESL